MPGLSPVTLRVPASSTGSTSRPSASLTLISSRLPPLGLRSLTSGLMVVLRPATTLAWSAVVIGARSLSVTDSIWTTPSAVSPFSSRKVSATSFVPGDSPASLKVISPSGRKVTRSSGRTVALER